MTDKCRVVIADDHQLFRDGLRRLLHSESGFEVVGEAPDSLSALKVARELKPDILLLDLAMPGSSGLEILAELDRSPGGTKTILLTASITREEVVRAMKLGAKGVLLKEATSQLLFRAIHHVMDGQCWVTRDTVTDLVEALKGNTLDQPPETPPKAFGLTRREREIVDLMVAGYTNADIARQCSISEQTVKHHVSSIYDKLGVYNRVELALFAVNHRLSQ